MENNKGLNMHRAVVILALKKAYSDWEEKTMATKKAFGGYSICFKGCNETAQDIFGTGNLAPSEMTKKIWAYVKKNKLAGK